MAEPGIYQTTITQPALFRDYLIEQVGLLLQNHRVGRGGRVGLAHSPHFAFPEGAYVEGEHLEALKRPLRDLFDVPDLAVTDDAIVNGSWRGKDGEPKPLAPSPRSADYCCTGCSTTRRPRPRISRTSCCSRTTSSTSTSSAPALAP